MSNFFIDLLFGKKEEPQTPLSDEELEKFTKRQELEYDSKTRIMTAKTKYDKAKNDHDKLCPKPSGSNGILNKKWVWLIGGVVFVILLMLKMCK
jgi:hypothetical protein